MADPDLLDETEEDLDLIRDVGTPVEQSGLGPVPSDLDEIAPDVAPDLAAAPEEAPVAPDVSTGLPPVQGTPAAAQNAAEAEALAKRQGEEDIERRRIEAETARRSAEAAREADEDARLAQADYLQRRQAAEQDLDTRTKAYETTKLVDPRTKNKGKAVLSVIFGGLGAAFRSAGGGDSSNHALANLQKQWHDDTELQKANIAALKDSAVQARTRLGDVDEGRRRMQRDADARLASKYNLALRQGEQQLKDRGVSQAEIDGDARILKLREGQAAAKAKALAAEDTHALNQARIEQMKRKGGTPGDLQTAQIRVMNARAAMLERKGKGGGGAKAVKPSEARAQRKFEDDKARKAAETELFDAETGESLGHAPSKERATHTSKRLEQLDVVRGDALRLKEHIDAEGTVAPSVPLIGNVTEASRTRQALANKLVTDVSAFQNLGAISKDDKKIIDGVIGGGSSYVLGLNSKQIDELTGAITRAKSSVLKSQGITKTGGAAAPAAAPAARFVPGQTRRLKDGRTVRITSADGDYEVVSGGRR
jgi:hypothetical protein